MIRPGPRPLILSLEAIDGCSSGRVQLFDRSDGEGEITIGRGQADFTIDGEDRFVGRGVHCRLRGPIREDGATMWELGNEHRNRIALRTRELGRTILENGDRVRFRTPATLHFDESGPSIAIESSEDSGRSETRTLLERSRIGDHGARDELLARNMDWILGVVRKGMGPGLRRRVDSQDMVQEAALRALEYSNFVVSDETIFRRVMVRIILNMFRDQHAHQNARKREVGRERLMSRDGLLSLDAPRATGQTPSGEAMRAELAERIRFALDLLDSGDRQVIHEHLLEKRTFREVGELLGITEDAARMRHMRALPRLQEILAELHLGKLDPPLAPE